jgi:hypothetical protein
MDTEHAFSATLILLMVCAAFPPDPANKASLCDALALLAGMWNRGNDHIGTRYLALHRLAADIAPGLLPPDPASGASPGAYGLADIMSQDMSLDGFLVSIDGMADVALGAAAPGFDQSLWEGALDSVMRE